MLLSVPNTSCCMCVNTATGYMLLLAPNTSFCWYINTAIWLHATTRPKHIPGICGLCQASIIDIVTRPRAAWPRKRGSIPRLGKRFCLLPNAQTDSRTHLVSYAKGNGPFFPGVKEARPSRWPDHSPPYSFEITCLSIYTSNIFMPATAHFKHKMPPVL